MQNQAALIQIFFEIAMSIDTGLEFEVFLKKVVSTYLRQLNCSMGTVIQIHNNDDIVSVKSLFTIPLHSTNTDSYKKIRWYIPETLEVEKWNKLNKSLPYVKKYADKSYYFFRLIDVGVFILVKNKNTFSPQVINLIEIINEKFAHAIKSAENRKRLQESERRYRELIEHQFEGVAIIEKDWQIGFANPAAHRLLEALDTPLTNYQLTDFIESENFELIKLQFETNHYKPKDAYEIKIRTLKHHDRIFKINIIPRFDLNNKKSGLFINFHDITGRIQSQEALKNSEKQSRDLANLLPQPVFEADKNGIVTFMNEAGFLNFGYPKTVINERICLFDLFTTVEEHKVRDIFNRVISGSFKNTPYELTAYRRDSTQFPVNFFIHPIVKSGLPIGVRGLIIDISKIKETENRLIEARDAAHIANAAKNEFISNMSHEIRTPLNAIMGYSQMLEMTLKDPVQRQKMSIIHESGQNLLNLINGVLDLSKLESGKIELHTEPVNFREFLLELNKLFSVKLKMKKLDYKIEFDEDLPDNIIIDRLRLQQILINLVGNAIKFTTQGHIGIRTNLERLIPPNFVDIRIDVFDTGIGIPKDRKEKIFEAFTQQDGSLKRQYGGIGLGLDLSCRLINLLGGRISLESEADKGSTFSVFLKNIEYTIPDMVESAADENPQALLAQILDFPKEKLLINNPDNTGPFLIDIKTVLYPKWEKLNPQVDPQEIKDFAGLIIEKAYSYGCSNLALFADQLLKALQDFTVDRVMHVLSEFPKTIKQIEDILFNTKK